EIDSQHRDCLDHMNKLSAVAESGSDHAEFMMLFEDVMKHAETHFSDEERLLAETSFPKLEQHREEHARILDSFKSMRRDIEGAAEHSEKWVSIAGAVIESMINHLVKWDMEYRWFLLDNDLLEEVAAD
ncbi:MAG: hemerythrin family protein, partial [Rhodospirillales bacterium]|nr:hemerythrin family protein [Rhodospirillales bacterium]